MGRLPARARKKTRFWAPNHAQRLGAFSLGIAPGDKEILKYLAHGLWVSWASVPANLRDGVERYLADRYPPLVGDCIPNVAPIAGNSPRR